MDEEAQHEYHVYTMASLDDSTATKQISLLKERNGDAAEVTLCGNEHRIQRPTSLSICYIGDELDIAVKQGRRSSSIDSQSSQEVADTDKMKTFLKSVISPRSDILSLTDNENISESGVQTFSNEEYGRLKTSQSLSITLLNDRADSDPSDKVERGRKSKTRTPRKNREPDSVISLDIEGETESILLTPDAPKGKIKKRKKSKYAKRKLAKMTKKLSDRQVLSPTYKQKNEDFHKFFKDLPVTERLLVDYACALVKDILVQGRLYVSQNYLCFHSTILKWQTVVTVNLVDIDQMTKEKTVKVIPNAIQVLLKDKTKITFTSFTARDRAFMAIFRLWQNALLDQPISPMQLWSQIHRNYGEELGGCSSDDDYVRPKPTLRKHEGIGDDGEFHYQFGTTNKIKRSATQSPVDYEYDKSNRSSKSTTSSPENHAGDRPDICFPIDDKSSHSSRDTVDNSLITDEGFPLIREDVEPVLSTPQEAPIEEQRMKSEDSDESDGEPAKFLMQNLPKHSFTRTYEVSVKDMYRIIFGDDCPFWRDTLVNKGTTGISFGTWKKDDSSPGQLKRELTYTLRLDNSFGPKTSLVRESQIYYACSVDGKSYVVDCIAQNYGIPYADYFHTAMRYSIRKMSKGTCELRITWELRYQKSPWGLVKNFIEKNVASGMSANFKKLQAQLQEHIDLEKSESQTSNVKASTKSNVRRRRLKSGSSATNRSLSRRRALTESPRKEIDQTEFAQDESGDKQRKSSTVVTGVPPLYTPNGFIPSEVKATHSSSPKLHYFGQGGKFIFGAMLFLVILLLYNNYNMSQRLNTLEQMTAAAATADGVDPSVTAALLDRPGIPISSNPEMLSSYLQAIDKRLRRLEDTVTKFTKESISKWEKIEKQWETMEGLVKKVMKSIVHEGS